MATDEPATDDGESFEDHLEAVEDAIRSLESGDSPLEDSIDLYAEAMRHLAACHGVLEKAEARLEIVRREAGGDAVVEPRPEDE